MVLPILKKIVMFVSNKLIAINTNVYKLSNKLKYEIVKIKFITNQKDL